MRFLPRMTEVVPLCTPDGAYLADARVPIGRGPRPELLRWQSRTFKVNPHGFYVEQLEAAPPAPGPYLHAIA